MSPDDEPLILTAMLDDMSQSRFERERQRYFPPGINRVPAHVTLFHHLPGLEQPAIDQRLSAISAAQPAVPFTTSGLRFLGRGTAYSLDMPAVAALRQELAREWQPWLTAQDRQPWRPHVTVQNKASASEAKQVYAALQTGFTHQQGSVTGLCLWRYLQGPWHLLARYLFIPPIAPAWLAMYH